MVRPLESENYSYRIGTTNPLKKTGNVSTVSPKLSTRKRIAYFCGRMGISCGLVLARWLPLTYLYLLAACIGKIGFYVMGKYRNIVYNNLQIAFGNAEDKKKHRAIAKVVFCDTVKNALEVAKLPFTDPSFIKRLVSVDGLEHLERALSRGRGAVAVSAHMGNFPLIGPRLITEGYRFSLVLRDPKDSILAGTLSDIRTALGMESIPVNPRTVCIEQSLKCLKRNGILFLQIDQNASSRDLWVDFFGWLVPTFKGPVVFSMRTGAPLIPLFTIRDAPDHHKLIISPPLALEATGDKDHDIFNTTAQLTKLIESYIRQYPAQWWWFHRRWKKARRSN